MKLAKWQGLGNDYLIIEESDLPAPLTARAIGLLCDRHYGVGSDGILLRARPTGAVPGAVARMRVFNPDGSEAEMCGNGIRMFARYLARSGHLADTGHLAGDGPVVEDEFVVETAAGPVKPRLLPDGTVRVDMGRARFRSENISPEAGGSSGAACGLPGRGAEDLVAQQRSGEEQSPPEQVALPAGDDVVNAVLEAGCWEYRFTFVDVGNPHCVIFVDDPATFDVAGVGRRIEKHRLFPRGVNVEFARVEPDGSVRMRVWERGVGETQACGTGAAAVGAACVRLGLVEGPVRVHLPGGDLTIEVVNDGPASVGGAVGGAGGDAGATTGGADAAEGATVGAVGGALPGGSAGRHDEAGAVSAAAGPAEGPAAARTGAGPRVFMTGPAEEVFTCHLSVDMLERLGWPATGPREEGGGRAVL